MTPAQYHRILVALDEVLEAFVVPSADFSPDDARLNHELRVIRSKVLRAESGHPFPFQNQPPPSPSEHSMPGDSGDGQDQGVEETALAATRIRTLIVDDQESVRIVVRLLLQSEPDIEIVGEARNGAEALRMVSLHQPEIVVMDVDMPVLDGLSATKQVLMSHPDTKVIIFSANRTSDYVEKAMEIGACGYVTKPASRKDLVKMVREVHDGVAVPRFVRTNTAGFDPN